MGTQFCLKNLARRHSLRAPRAGDTAPTNNINQTLDISTLQHTAMSSLNQFISSTTHPSNATLALIGTNEDNDENLMPWEREGWRPLEKSGKQKTPNKIRGELQRYIDACKAGKSSCVLCSSC